ncbi:uncharacterized protein [Parasteatoda tepidariorum]|uniref:uncharacterized protein isoform X2 n=1 Tax=Parasteatoda tepidariorum TaxID=114398 RepID=UPI00077FBC05|nr:RNA-binding protein lark isoform X2 [Parasteatoda tepidariorum]
MSAPRTKLFVGHLPDGCTNEELQTLFEKYGAVKECDVINKYGFVHMSTSEEAEDAIKALNNYHFRGSSLSVERSKSKLHPEPGAPGRAKGGVNRNRDGYGGGRSRGGGGYSNGYGRYDGPPPFGGRGDFYNDRGYGGGMSPRMRPYPSPYDRSPMPPPRDDYYSRSSPYSMASRDPYARPVAASRDLYDRRATAYPSTSDYLYSRRSPPPMSAASRSSYWSNDYYGDASAKSYYGEYAL